MLDDKDHVFIMIHEPILVEGCSESIIAFCFLMVQTL